MDKSVLILTDRFYPEEFIINDLVPEFVSRMAKVEILTQNPSYPYGKVNRYPGFKNSFFSTTEWNSVSIKRLFTIQGYRESKILKVLHYFSFAFLCSLYLLVRGKKYSQIFVFQTGPLLQAVPAIIWKKIYRRNVAIWTLDLWPDAVFAYGFSKNKLSIFFLNGMVRTVYKNCKNIFVSSRGFSEKIKEIVPEADVLFLPQWPLCSFDAKVEENILDDGFLNFTFAGNIAKTQNLENVIEGFAKAVVSFDKIRLNIFGDGSNLDYLKEIVDQKKINGIIFHGRVAPEKMNSILKQSDVLVISLKPDPLYDLYVPLKFSSYLLACKPIFAVMNGEVKSMVKDYSIGLAADPSDISDIASGFSRFAKAEPEELEIFAKNTELLRMGIFNREKNVNVLFAGLQT